MVSANVLVALRGAGATRHATTSVKSWRNWRMKNVTKGLDMIDRSVCAKAYSGEPSTPGYTDEEPLWPFAPELNLR